MTQPHAGAAPAPPPDDPGAARGVSAPAYLSSPLSANLPVFPWDRLEPAKATAAAHPDGIVDLSVGTPVDPVPDKVQGALRAAADAPGYPATAGTARLVGAVRDWLLRRTGAEVAADGVLPLVGSKELVAWLPTQLGLGRGDVVAFPELAYPTYEVGARLAGATAAPYRDVADLSEQAAAGALKMLWLNSPSNPTGRVRGVEELRAAVAWARERGVLVVSDECYLELGWDAEPVSVLHPSVCGGDHRGLLALHSLSKRSNLAGYRAAFAAGDPAVVGELLQVRKHGGMIVPRPVQDAVVAALGDTVHVDEQRARYAQRRAALRTAFEKAGYTIEHSEAGLYLWATRGESCWATVDALAARGVLVAPGEFYGPAGEQHVRIALTATDERVRAAVARLG